MSHGLFLDTSLRGLQMALLTGASSHPEVVWQTTVSDNPGSSGRIGALFKAGLAQAGITTGDLDVILVGSGPGSFTGIKIGLAFVYGLKRALEHPVACYGFSALELISKQLSQVENSPVQVALAATQSQGFLCSGRAHNFRTQVVVAGQSMAEMAIDAKLPVDFLEGWPVFQQNLEKIGVSGRILPIARWRVLLFDAMVAEYAAKIGAGGDGRQLPEPNFMRFAAPVEKQMQKSLGSGAVSK